MKILTVKNASLEKITLGDPNVYDDIMYVEIYNNKDHLYVQTPKMYSKVSDNKKSMCLFFENSKGNYLKEFYKLVRSLEKTICSIVSEKSEEWFPKKVSCDSFYNDFLNSSINVPDEMDKPFSMNVNIPYSNGEYNFEIYNIENKKINEMEIKDNIKSVLIASELVITSSNAYIVWELSQVKLYNKIKKVYSIVEDKNENEKIKLKEKHKKTKKTKPKPEQKPEPKEQEPKEKLKVNLIENSDNDSLDGYISSSDEN